MNPVISGAIGEAVGGFLGGKLGGSGTTSRKKQLAAARSGKLQHWHDVANLASQRYGIHPLIALGSTPYQSTGSTGIDHSYATGQLGANLGKAIGSARGRAHQDKQSRARQIVLDNKALEKHDAEIRVLNSEANKNDAIASGYAASKNGRAGQKQQLDQLETNVPPNYPNAKVEPLKNMGTPKGGITYHDPGGLGKMHIPGGLTAAQMLEEMVGEPENPLNWPRMMNILLNHMQKRTNNAAQRHRKKYKKLIDKPYPGYLGKRGY